MSLFSKQPIGTLPGLNERNPSLAYRLAFDALRAIRRYRNAVAPDVTAGGTMLRDVERVLASRCSAFEKAGVTVASPDVTEPTTTLETHEETP